MSTTFTLPQTVVKRLEKISASSKRSPAAIVKEAVQERLKYEEWALKQIEAGLADVKAGRVISHAEMVARMERKIRTSAHGRKKAA